METTGGEGKISGRKRLRGKIGNPSTAPELKMHNLINVGDDTAQTLWIDRAFYGSFTRDDTGVWYPWKCNWPQMGISNHTRIGKNIRVKYLRVKGYVAYSPYLITQVRYRIVLYRHEPFGILSYDSFTQKLYSNAANMNENGLNSLQIQDRCCFNYYCGEFSKIFLKDNGIKRRVLAKGVIKPQADVPDFYNNNGQLVYSGQFLKHRDASGHVASQDQPSNSRGFFPIDITVNMNDRVEYG